MLSPRRAAAIVRRRFPRAESRSDSECPPSEAVFKLISLAEF